MGIFSDVSPYDKLSALCGWELLCGNTTDSWYSVLKLLMDHPRKLDELKQSVAVLVETSFSVGTIAAALQKELQEVPVQYSQRGVNAAELMMTRVRVMTKRLTDGLKRYGM